MVDLTYPLTRAPTVADRHAADTPGALTLYRHSTAHLLAAAVTQLFPRDPVRYRPATDEGFFYDFVVERPFVPEVPDVIENRMRELATRTRLRAPDVAARRGDEVLPRRREPLKVTAD